MDTFELRCWRRLLSIPWTARRSNLPILKKISSEYPLEGLMLKLKLQYFGHLMCITDSLKRTWCWERLKAGGEGDDRGWDGWMASLTPWTGVWARFGDWWWTGKSSTLQSMGSQRVGHDWATELNWTERFILNVFSKLLKKLFIWLKDNCFTEFSCFLSNFYTSDLIVCWAQSCLSLCDLVNCSPPGSCFFGIFQARILVWVTISFSRGSSKLRDRTHVSCVSCFHRLILYH